MSAPKFQIGDDLFVHEAARFVEGATSVVGPVEAVSAMDDGSSAYTIAASIGRPWGGVDRPPEGRRMMFAERDLGLRTGTPISQLSGRPGHPGYDRFKSIAASWGHD